MKLIDEYNVESKDDLAPTTRRTYGPSGGIVPGYCAGYVYDGAAFCPECAAEIDVPTADGESHKMDAYPADATDGHGFGVGVISGFDEWDEPGASCDVCHRRLRTNIIRYE
ncbi:hypothetical protein M1M38_gp101 [Halorubrum tailed virus 27]|uniref:Uncharacterized protein n=1 Tax=Halorubrum tailed virus 27 TaxID=2878008 RepID=A0AAE9BYE1_9CAUD|nr:hypothetical protein M1M38_gp101 [Halorubrum tailed virus 27]UBF22794.1 hypothetical protein HRTV-27_gp101 [Halorubrum tailed virus 27]